MPGTETEEHEANYFAMCLLMPDAWLRDDVPKVLDAMTDEKSIAALAKKYDVSVMHMTMRLTSLGLLR